MKTSFYFVLWIGAFLLIDVFGTPAIKANDFGMALMFVLLVSSLFNKFASGLINYQVTREHLKMFELCYNNEHDKFVRVFRNSLLVEVASFVYLAMALVGLFAFHTPGDFPWLAICVFGFALYMTIKGIIHTYRNYTFVKNQIDIVFPNDGIQAMYNKYIEMRETATFEEICPKPELKDKLFRIFGLAMASLSTIIGLTILVCFLPLLSGGTDIAVIVMTQVTYGSLAIYFGVTDLISIYKGCLKLY